MSENIDESSTVVALSALAQGTRLRVFRALVAAHPEGIPAGEIAARCGVPHNTMSSHLAILARAGLAQADRQGRTVYYRADLDGFRDLVGFLTRDCCDGRPEICAPVLDSIAAAPCCPTETPMADRVFNVLFLCTGNSARSIMAESILRKDGAGRFRVFSAGSMPRGEVNPFALKVLARAEYPTDGLRSKDWSEFGAEGAPHMDFVFTVCDNAAGEVCPVWPGQPMTAHWGIEDPSAVEGNDIQKETAFVAAFRYLKNRITAFAALPVASLDRLSLQASLNEIGRGEGATNARNPAA
jgi:arsenate reductase